ncbi:protein PRRC1-like isoform X3 [Cotesia glomerata]|uniref:protein PRRC1-like isoform X3 n=1 Tax=Cotesia glomerata TaxID=32391 RepID=UPI001D0099A5|nr:protein PRRC1-like isoform X3 [Cotesia glomerata]
MTDESNGESTFEFVEKRVDDVSISGETTKTDSMSSLLPSVSIITPLSGSSSAGNLLSNVAPPSALPSFIANQSPPLDSLPKETGQNAVKVESTEKPEEISGDLGVQTKQPQAQGQQTPTESQKPLESVCLEDNQSQDMGIVGASLFSWVKDNVVNNSMLSKVAEKAKSSVNSMITTLDPQMREFIYSGGDVEIVVASNKEVKVSPIREAFQEAFGKATITGVAIDTSAIPAQPVGFAAGVNGAKHRIKYARNALEIPKDIPIIAVQSFLVEIGEDKWYELAVILLDDPKNDVNLQMFTQMTPVPSQFVSTAKESTPDTYPLKTLGLAVSIGSLMSTNLQVNFNEWHHALSGVSRRDTILLAAQSLAGIYKNTITTV